MASISAEYSSNGVTRDNANFDGTAAPCAKDAVAPCPVVDSGTDPMGSLPPKFAPSLLRAKGLLSVLAADAAAAAGLDSKSVRPQLAPVLLERLESKKLSSELVEEFYQNIIDYAFMPGTVEDLDILSSEAIIELMKFGETHKFFEFLKKEFGLKFVPRSALLLKQNLRWDEFYHRLIMNGIDIADPEQYAKFLDVLESSVSKTNAAVTLAENTQFMHRLQTRFGAAWDLDGVFCFADFARRKEGGSAVSEKDVTLDIEKLKPIADGKFLASALHVAMVEATYPGFVDRLAVVYADLNPSDISLKQEAIEFVNGYKPDSGLKELIAWASKYFGLKFSIGGLATINDNLPQLGLVGGIAVLNEDKARQVQEFLQENNIQIEPKQIIEAIWTKDATDLHVKAVSAFGVEALSAKNLRDRHAIFNSKENVFLDPRAFLPDVVAAAKALTGNLSLERTIDLTDISLAIRILFEYEKEVPGSLIVLKKLLAAGLKFGTHDLRSNFYEIASIVGECLKDASLLDDIINLLNSMPELASSFQLSQLQNFIACPQATRRLVVRPRVVAFHRLLRDVYRLEMDYDNIMLNIEEGSYFRRYGKYYLEPALQEFFAEHRELFLDNKTADSKLGILGAPAVLELYLLSQKDPQVLELTRRWREMSGKPIDVLMVRWLIGDQKADIAFVLNHERLKELTAALKVLGIDANVDSSIFELNNLFPLLDKLLDKEFQKFYSTLTTVFGMNHWLMYLQVAVRLFDDPEKRAFFLDKKTQTSFGKLKGFGFEIDWHDLSKLRRLLATPNLIEDLGDFEKKYGIQLAKAIPALKEAADPVRLWLLRGASHQDDADFFDDWLLLEASGDAKLLLGDGAQIVLLFLRDKLGYDFSLGDLSSFLSFLKSNSIRPKIISRNFVEFWKKLQGQLPRGEHAIPFELIFADILADLAAQKEAVFDLMSKLLATYNYVPRDYGDLILMRDLIGNVPAQQILFGERCRAFVLKLATERYYKFDLGDTWALIHFSQHHETVEQMFSKGVDDFISTVFGSKVGSALSLRCRVATIIKNSTAEELLFYQSDERKVVTEKIKKYEGMGLQPVLAGLKGLFVIYKNPQIINFLEAISFAGGLGISQNSSLLPHAESLASIANHPSATVLITALQGLRGKIPGAHYQFMPADSLALVWLLNKFPADKIIEIAQRLLDTVPGRITGNDIYYAAMQPELFEQNRRALEGPIRAGFNNDVHRMDSDFDSYASYNNPSRLSAVGISKVALLRSFFERPETIRAVGALIRKDISEYTSTELGGVISLGDRGLNFVEAKPDQDFSNISFSSEEMERLEPTSVVDFHLHALTVSDVAHAGPSGLRFGVGGDVGVAEGNLTDGIVITPVDATHFCVHFYDRGKNVIFLGTYEIPK